MLMRTHAILVPRTQNTNMSRTLSGYVILFFQHYTHYLLHKVLRFQAFVSCSTVSYVSVPCQRNVGLRSGSRSGTS